MVKKKKRVEGGNDLVAIEKIGRNGEERESMALKELSDEAYAYRMFNRDEFKRDSFYLFSWNPKIKESIK